MRRYDYQVNLKFIRDLENLICGVITNLHKGIDGNIRIFVKGRTNFTEIVHDWFLNLFQLCRSVSRFNTYWYCPRRSRWNVVIFAWNNLKESNLYLTTFFSS